MSLVLISAPARGRAQDRKDEKPALTDRLKKLNGAAREQWAAHLTAQAERRYLERDYEAALASYRQQQRARARRLTE